MTCARYGSHAWSKIVREEYAFLTEQGVPFEHIAKQLGYDEPNSLRELLARQDREARRKAAA